MNRLFLVAIAGATMLFSAGCSTKKYVRNEAAPIINKTNELDDLTAKNSRDIRDVDTRAQQGIQGVNDKTAAVDQKAIAAGQAADQAQQAATQTAGRVDTLNNTVANLDNYRPVAETSVHFAFNSAVLSKKAKEALDQLGNDIPNTKGYVLQLIGGTDSVGTHYKVKEATGPAGYDVWVGDDGYVHRVVVAQSSPKVSVTIDLSKFGEKVTAAAPPAAQVYESKNGSLPGLGGVGA